MVSSFARFNFFCLSIIINSIFISQIRMIFSFALCHTLPPREDFYGWLLNTTIHSDDHLRVAGPCRKQLNRWKCVFCNLIDAFWICLDEGYTCLCIFIMLGWMKGSRLVLSNVSLMMLPADTVKDSHVSTRTEFMWWRWNLVVPYFSIHIAVKML